MMDQKKEKKKSFLRLYIVYEILPTFLNTTAMKMNDNLLNVDYFYVHVFQRLLAFHFHYKRDK